MSRVFIKAKKEYSTIPGEIYKILDQRRFISGEWIQVELETNSTGVLHWVKLDDVVAIDEDEKEEDDHWLDQHWFGFGRPVRDVKFKRLKCDCGAAAVGNIPHSDWCSLKYLEPGIAKKREPRNEWDT